MTNQDLKPCPFCGGEGVLLLGSGAGKVGCVECFSEAHVDTWNRRLNSWISVEERLPEEDGLYLVAHKPPNMPAPGVAVNTRWYYKGFWGMDVYATITESVTHWQPLPKPPIEGGGL